MILSISQSPQDFLSSAVSKSVLSNAYTKYILKMQKDYELLEQFDLTEQEIDEVKSLKTLKGEYSEVFIKFMNDSRIIRIQPTKCDYWVCTTDPDDYNKEMKIRKQHSSENDLQILKRLIEV